MFETLFKYPGVLRRHQDGPAADARQRYLVHCATQGAAPATLASLARELLVIATRLDVTRGTLLLQEIEAAAWRWASDQQRRHRSHGSRWSHERFVQVASAWCRFLGCLAPPPLRRRIFAAEIDDFAAYMRDERGLSPATIRNRCWHVENFLGTVDGNRPIAEIGLEDFDAFLVLKGTQGWCRVSVASAAEALRAFFRHAEHRGWMGRGISAGIDAPRLFKQEGLPRGPQWADVRRLIADAEGARPRDIRDRAILMLFAIYGLRSGEVAALRLEDLDWTREIIRVTRSQQRRVQEYPLVPTMGEAILRYLQEARPRCAHREIFLTVRAPIRPLSSAGGLHYVVQSRLSRLGIQLPHRGPHCLRHACASHLVASGLSLKEIGDHLGHRSAYATRTYAKVDLAGLREVADFRLGDLL